MLKKRVVALLHDVVEDTDITIRDFSIFFSPEIIEAIKAISLVKVYDKKRIWKGLKLILYWKSKDFRSKT